MQRFPTYCTEMRLGSHDAWVDVAEEDRKFNTDHCVVGYLVARHWLLPEFICDAVRNHHALGEMGENAARSMVAIIQLAIEIYCRDRHVPNPEWERMKGDVLPELGLSDDALPEFVDVVLEQFRDATSQPSCAV